MENAIRKRLAAHAAAPAHGGMRARSQDLVHPSTGVGGPPAPEPHNAATGFQRELFADQGSQVSSPENYIPAREQWVKGCDAQLSCHRFEGFDGYQGDCGVHVRGFAKEPVTDNALPAYDVDLLGIRGGHLGGAIACAAEVGVSGRHEEMQDLHVVSVAWRHAIRLCLSGVGNPRAL